MATIESSIALYDSFSPVLNNIMDAMNLTIACVRDMQGTMEESIDTSTFQAAENAIHQAGAAMENLNRQIQSGGGNVNISIPSPEPVQVPVHWQVDNMEVFTNTGIERFQQEIQSANAMMNTMFHTQVQIISSAGRMDIMPPEAVENIRNMGNRLQTIQQRINAIENNPLNFGSNEANVELERLRMQLANAINAQNDLNEAVQEMDVSAANTAYLRLSGTVANTERYLRDNTDEQGRFNQEIQNGATTSDGLLSKIKQIAGAYLTIQGIGKVIELSDTVTQTEARLGLIVDDGGSVEELQQKIFNAAQDARADYMTTADAVSKLGTQAGDAFTSNDELIAFTTLLNKEFVNAGTSAQGIDSVMLQLTQSMAAGKLQGEELNAVLDNAAPIVSKIKTYLEEVQGIDATNIKELASKGVLTADVVKNAMFYAAEEIDETFNNMPMTFEQVANSIKNNALVAFDPVLKKLNDIANSERFNSMVNGIIAAFTVMGAVVTEVIDLLVTGAALIYDNWSWIGPIVYGVVGALVVYYGWQLLCAVGSTIMAGAMALLSANPVILVIMALAVLIGVIFAVSDKIADMTGVAETGFGVICGAINVVIAFFINLGLTATNISLGITYALIALCGNMQTAFHNAICNVQSWFYNLLSTALKVIAGICEALNQLPFVEFDYSGITAKAEEYAAKSAEATGKKEEYDSISEAFSKGMSTFNTFQDGWASRAFAAGASWGDGIAAKISNKLSFGTDDKTSGYDPNAYLNDLENIASDASGSSADTAKNTADIADALDITNDELKYLRDIKEQEIIDRTVYRDIIVDIGEMKNTVKNEADLDGIASRLANHITEQIKISAEGV